MSEPRVLSWDWKEYAPMEQIAELVREVAEAEYRARYGDAE